MTESLIQHPGLVCVLLGVGVCLALLRAATRAPAAFEVVLVSAGARRIAVIKSIREHTGLGLAESKRLTDAPQASIATLPADQAEALARDLRAAGAVVRLCGRDALPGARARGLTRVRVAGHERVFVHRRDGYQRMLGPGAHRVWGRAGLVRISCLEPALRAPELAVYLRDQAVRADLTLIELRQDQRAVVWQAGRVHSVLGPGRHAFWQDADLQVETHTVSASDPRFTHAQLEAVHAAPGGREALEVHAVGIGHVGLLRVDGSLVDELAPGRVAVWTGVAQVEVERVDTRRRTVEAATMAWTRDKVELSLTVTADFRVHAPRVAAETLDREVGAALRIRVAQAVGLAASQQTFDELTTGATALMAEVERELSPRLRSLGLTLERIGLQRLDPPGDVRALLIQAVEARTRAEAERVTRREETAAARSQLNTARLLERSPELKRLRELEAAERIAAQVGQLQVTAGGGGLTRLVDQLLPKA